MYVIFFFKQKSSYEMRISDWSSDVCSSDLIELADTLFFLVREPRGHRPRGDEYLRQVPETQRADQQAGNDLVADDEQQRALQHHVAQRDRGALRDIVAAEKQTVQPRLPLRHPVAHS